MSTTRSITQIVGTVGSVGSIVVGGREPALELACEAPGQVPPQQLTGGRTREQKSREENRC